MIVLTPRRVGGRVLASLVDAAFGTLPFLFVYFTRHPIFISAWLQIGLPFALFAPARFFALTVLYPPPEVGWDRDGLQIRRGKDLTSIPWSEYAGYRFTWDLPRRLRLNKTSRTDPITIDLTAFDDDRRDAFMTELALHSAALPN